MLSDLHVNEWDDESLKAKRFLNIIVAHLFLHHKLSFCKTFLLIPVASSISTRRYLPTHTSISITTIAIKNKARNLFIFDGKLDFYKMWFRWFNSTLILVLKGWRLLLIISSDNTFKILFHWIINCIFAYKHFVWWYIFYGMLILCEWLQKVSLSC